MQVDKMRQYLHRSCLVISRVKLPPNKTAESTAERENALFWYGRPNFALECEITKYITLKLLVGQTNRHESQNY